MRLLVFVFFCLVLFPDVQAATTSKNCSEVNFAGTDWQALARSEPRLQQHVEEIAMRSGQQIVSGQDILLTNCKLRFAVNSHGEMIDGTRVLIGDKHWEVYKNGEYKRAQMGMKIVYKVRRDVHGKVLELRGFSVCWGPDGCREMNIPFRDSES